MMFADTSGAIVVAPSESGSIGLSPEVVDEDDIGASSALLHLDC